MKNFLILDTSTEIQFFALVYNSMIKDTIKVFGKKNYVSNCVPLIQKLFKKNNINLKDLDGLIVGVGPGSYTGTRVAVLTAKVFSFSLKIPLYRISSLLLLVSGYNKKFLTPLINARNNFFFSLSLTDYEIILPEGRYSKIFLTNYKNHILINDETIKLDIKKIFFYMKEVIDIHSLVPNYLI